MPTAKFQEHSPREREVMEKLGLRVRELRENAGMSQERLAELAEVHRTYISTIERGKQNISLAVIIRLADVLGIDLETLFTGI